MRKQIEDDWEGWDGDTVIRLTDGSVWRQAEYYYEYRYAYRPQVILDGNTMYVGDMRRGVRVRRID